MVPDVASIATIPSVFPANAPPQTPQGYCEVPLVDSGPRLVSMPQELAHGITKIYKWAKVLELWKSLNLVDFVKIVTVLAKGVVGMSND